MKKTRKHLLVALCAGALGIVPISALTGCNDTPQVTTKYVSDFVLRIGATTITTAYTGYLGESETVNAIPVVDGETSTFKFSSNNTDAVMISTTGVMNFNATGTAVIKVTAVNDPSKDDDDVVKQFTLTVGPSRVKTGVSSYAASSYEDKLEILGNLEEYAIKKHLTGLTLFENGGQMVYSNRVKIPTAGQEYITGYGFGVLSDGELNGELTGTAYKSLKTEWQSYYQSATSTGVKDICYLDDQGSLSSDLYSYISSGLYGTKLNTAKNNYEWTQVLARSEPIPVKDDGTALTQAEIDASTGLFSKFKIYVKTGASTEGGIKYHTLSTTGPAASYNNTPVSAEDYVTAYKNLLTQKNGFFRGTEMTSLTGSGVLKGALTYYNASKGGINNSAWDNVGLKAKTDTNGSYLEFTLQNPLSIFYAKYNLGGTLVMPVPQAFLTALGEPGEVYGKGSQSKGWKILDTILSLGAYDVEQFDTNATEIIYKKNPNYGLIDTEAALGGTRYKIPGVRIRVIDSSSDADAFIKEFKAGNLDAAGVTKSTLNDSFDSVGYKKKTKGDSTFKLNINACTSEEWDYNFGPNGKISQNAAANKWPVKPFMSNSDFLDAISKSIDRQKYADARGVNPSQDYFAPNYLWDPEGKEASATNIPASYSETNIHKNNLYSPSTYGFDLEAAKQQFKVAINSMVNKKQITLPYTGELHIVWMNTTDEKEYGRDIKEMIETACNDKDVSDGKFTLNVINDNGTSDYQEVYTKMRNGQFDLGFGSISGMDLDPLGFIEVLKSDNSSGFTLNFGTDTSIPDKELTYDGSVWSFDALWTAATKGAIIDDKGIVYTSPITPDEKQIQMVGEDAKYRTYKILINEVNATGASIEKIKTGNVAILNWDEISEGKTIVRSATVMFDDVTAERVSDGTYSNSDAFYYMSEGGKDYLYVIVKIDGYTLDDVAGTHSLKDNSSTFRFNSIDVTCNYVLNIDIGGGKIVPSQSSFTFTI